MVSKPDEDQIVEAVERLEVINLFNIEIAIEVDEITQIGSGVVPINDGNQPVEENIPREGDKQYALLQQLSQLVIACWLL